MAPFINALCEVVLGNLLVDYSSPCACVKHWKGQVCSNWWFSPTIEKHHCTIWKFTFDCIAPCLSWTPVHFNSRNAFTYIRQGWIASNGTIVQPEMYVAPNRNKIQQSSNIRKPVSQKDLTLSHPLKKNNIFSKLYLQNLIYGLHTRKFSKVHFSNELAFKKAFQCESNIIFSIDSEDYATNQHTSNHISNYHNIL